MLHFDTELDGLKQKLLAMASHAETAVNQAVRALMERDHDLALQVKDNDRVLDQFEIEIDDLAIHLLAKAPLASAYVTALAQAPLDEALARVEELFAGRMDRLTDGYTTHGHYARFQLNVVEAVVLALANEDFALGPAARRWLDDDEYLVRRRIHRDVRAALARAGM